MRRRSYRPTREDKRIFEKVAQTGNYNYFFEYYMGIELMPWQMYLHQSPAGDTTVIGGVGCLAADVPIYNPLTGREVPIGELAHLQQKSYVLAWDEWRGFLPAKADPPFKKGTEGLYRVVLADGKEVTATLEHRFLTPQGFLPLRSLSCESLIGVVPKWDQTIRDSNVPHYWQILEGYQGDCWSCHHQCDAPPPQGRGDDQFSPLQSSGAHRCNHYSLRQGDLQERGQGYIHHHLLSDRPSSNGLAFHASPPQNDEGCPHAPFGGEHAQGLARRLHQQSWHKTSQDLRARESDQPYHQGGKASCDSQHQDTKCQEAEYSYQDACGRGADSHDLFLGARPLGPSCGTDHTTHPEFLLSDETSLYEGYIQALRQAPCGSQKADSLLSQGGAQPCAKRYAHGKDSRSALSSGLVSWFGSPYHCDVTDYNTKAQWVQIAKIEYVGKKDFYDLHVPVFNNYVAGGMIHHNSGKTIYKAVSELGHGIFSAKYKFMNLAPTAWQSQLMFNAMVDHIRDNPMERFLARDPVERPWPRIELTTGSSMEFRSASDIRLIQGWEGDSLAGDEFGILADGDTVISGMASRLRGRISVGGKTRFRRGRLEIMTMPYMVQWLWTRYDAPLREKEFKERHNRAITKGQALHLLAAEDMVSMTVASASNVGLSEKDLGRMRRRISEHLVEIQMSGARPMGLGEHFSMNMMRLCEDWGMNALMEEAVREKRKGYDEIVVPSIGPITWRIPRQRDHLYMLVGDPGSLNPPRRNSPVVAVWDVTDFPRGPARMVCFRWVYGRGSYDPFLQAFFEEYMRYRPQWALFDATGVQKSFDEIVFRQWGLMAEGVDLSGMKKAAGLTAAKILMGRALLKWPFISGVRQQLTSYILPDTKINQDIVSMFTILGYKLREYLDTDTADAVGVDEVVESAVHPRNVRSARGRARSGQRTPRQRTR